jgi:hypothetical protein
VSVVAVLRSSRVMSTSRVGVDEGDVKMDGSGKECLVKE